VDKGASPLREALYKRYSKESFYEIILDCVYFVLNFALRVNFVEFDMQKLP
jgi:hypothetical protein